MLLNKDDIRAAGGIVHSDGNVFFTNIDQLNAAVLAKLTSGVEVPEQSRSFLCTKCGSHECEEGTITKDYPPCAKCGYLGFAASNGHTDEALLAYGASQRLAGREQAIEECKNVVRKKCASPTAYEAIRALAASPQEQI